VAEPIDDAEHVDEHGATVWARAVGADGAEMRELYADP
jgi:hypothetical protein